MFGIFLPLKFQFALQGHQYHRFLAALAHDACPSFLRDYLYIPLGGNRHGPTLRYVNLMITMAARRLVARRGLDVLWRGARLHGVYLCINHAWNYFGPKVAPAFLRAWQILPRSF